MDATLCVLGRRYGHDEVLGDGVEQRAAVGTRAPHLWLDGRGVHDLFHDSFVLLTGRQGEEWVLAAGKVEGVRAHRVDHDLWRERYDLGEDGAVLVRPDGYVAWRAEGLPSDPAAALRHGVNAVLRP